LRTKRVKRGNKIIWIPLGIVLFLGALVLLIANIDIAGDFVARQAQSAANDNLQADLKLFQVKGNPLRGYKIFGVSLSKDGAEMFKAEFIEAKIDLMSLLSSPRLSLLSIGGVNMDLDKFVEELNKLPSQPSDQPFQIPIDELKLVQSRFISKWGSVDVEDVALGFNEYTVAARVKGKVNDLPVAGTLTAEIKGSQVELMNADLKVGKGTVKAFGKLSETLDIQGFVEGLDVTELASLWPALSPEDYSGAVSMTFKVTGTSIDPVFTATADFKGARLGGWPVESFDGAVNYKDKRFSLDRITASILGIPLEGNVAMASRDKIPTVFIQLNGGAVDLAALENLGGIKGVTGNISDFTAEIKGPIDTLSGTISLHAPSVGAKGVKGTDVALQVKLTEGNRATVNGKMQLQGAATYLSGTVSDILTGIKLNLTLKTVDLNIAGLKPLIPDANKIDPKGTMTAEVHIRGKMSDPSLDGTLSSKSLTAAEYTVDNLAIGFSFAQGNFTLKDSSASWSGLPIKASGTIKNVMAAKPALDIKASLSFSPASLAKFVPDIAQYKLKGTVQVGVHATGALPEPKLDLVISSSELTAEDITAKNIKVTTALTGDLAKLDNMDLDLTAQSVSASGLGFQNINAKVKKTGETINLTTAKASSGQGSLSASGRITVPDKGTGDININVDMTQLDLKDISKTGDLGVELAGTFSGKLSISGKTDAPTVSFQGNAPKLSVAGYTMDNMTMGLSGNMANLKLDNFSAQIGTGKLSATGNLKPQDNSGQIDFTGTGLDLAKLTENVPNLKGQIAGILSVKFNATFSAKGASGQGNTSAPSLMFYGMKLSDVSLPLALDGVNFKFGHGTAKLNGGTLSLNGDVNTETMKYTGKLNASDVDINALIHDLVPDIGGRITGRGAMDVSFSGAINPSFTLGGTGQAKIGSGGLSGFKWIDLISKLHGVDSVRYTDVTAPFKLETTRIIFQKGSRANAPENDPLYKYAQIEGPVTYAGDLNLTGDGNMNFQLINIAAGGALGAAGAVAGGNINELLSGKGLESILTQTAGRGIAAGKQADFRDVSFKIGGNADKPSFSIVKVGPSSIKEDSGSSNNQPQNLQEAVRDRVLEGLGIPTRPANETPPQQQQQQQQPTPPEAREEPKKPQDVIKEEAGNALRDLIRRRK